MSSASETSHIMRPMADFSPNIWGYHFFNSASPPLLNGGPEVLQRSQRLREKVRKLIVAPVEDPTQKLNLIDNVKRLGVSYHFESEIEEILQNMHKNPPPFKGRDLHAISLYFRLLRQQGYHAPSDIFDQFMDENGDFKKSLLDDVGRMLSLYEAAHFGIHGEHVLDQAIHFTSYHLKSRLGAMSPNLERKVSRALNFPIRKGIPRLESRYYIPIYSAEASPNDPLLELAVLDFHLVQLLHKEELQHVTEWWKKLDFATKVPYARDRVVEAYFWPLGVYYEPQYIIGRTIVGKLIAVTSAVDDTYDAYGTLEELELFTEAVRRWDASPLDPVPECMKVVFHALLDLFNEMELLTEKEGKSCFVPYVKETFQKLAEAYLVEAKWCNQGHIPTYEEYVKNGVVTSCYPLLEIASFLGLGNLATKHVFDWISNVPRIVRASAIICRLTDDTSSHKFERKRAHVASAVECLMKQHGISEGEAYKILQKDLDNVWKDINEECLKRDVVPKVVLDCVVNFSSVIELVYGNFADKYTHAELLKDHVAALVVDPVDNLQ
ncbi:(-)-germacrene D synthase-like [Neltuma alba]|uniref:(-)-germacrene D synthase-like n=1 Tax=Neltuma alba TaxID=207710 RepID=UPI0010A31417|nr:(-)-germacrene D synthase-like [Prosopis alba]